jgi:diacylglycerol kinase family enzyme
LSVAPVSPPGSGLGILVNANAKRGGRRIAVQIARALPGASVRLTRTIEEIEGWLGSLRSPRCIFAAGGDGTAVALVNALNRVVPKNEPFPPVGILPLGTGNAWAHATGAHKLGLAVGKLHRCTGALPVRSFGLVDCEGTLTTFAGTGWDAQILDDYRAQLEASVGPGRIVSKSVWGYLSAMLFRTTPKTILHGRPHVTIENLGDEVYTMTADRKLLKIANVSRGSVLYEGLASVAGAATAPEFGYGFRAYPFAERLLGFVNVRVYDRPAIGALTSIPGLWRGQHPLRGMHDWFTKAVRMTFSRPMPLQIAGDAVGTRQTVEYRASERLVDVVDWRRLD